MADPGNGGPESSNYGYGSGSMGHTCMTSHTLDGYTKGILISTDGPVASS